MMIMILVFLMMIFMVRLLMFTIIMMGWRRSNQTSWLPMIGTSMGFSLKDVRGQRSAITHSVAVSEVTMVPFLLQILFQISIQLIQFIYILAITLGLQKPNSEQQGAWGGQPLDQYTSYDLKVTCYILYIYRNSISPEGVCGAATHALPCP